MTTQNALAKDRVKPLIAAVAASLDKYEEKPTFGLVDPNLLNNLSSGGSSFPMSKEVYDRLESAQASNEGRNAQDVIMGAFNRRLFTMPTETFASLVAESRTALAQGQNLESIGALQDLCQDLMDIPEVAAAPAGSAAFLGIVMMGLRANLEMSELGVEDLPDIDGEFQRLEEEEARISAELAAWKPEVFGAEEKSAAPGVQ
jgi:hypothetical protein